MTSLLFDIASRISSQVEHRLFAEYGAIFVTTATPPPTIIFTDAASVAAFQATLSVDRAIFGEHEIELQASALEALAGAAAEIADSGGSITARAADAGSRSYEDTMGLWTRNVTRGLRHWEDLGRISSERAESILGLGAAEQVEAILELEDREYLFFGTHFDRSILYSVAAPGASQHLSMIAFDVAEYEDAKVDDVLGRHGWYRTVPNDLPHFTFLGRDQDTLTDVGLKRITRSYGGRAYNFWIPDIARLGRPS